MKMIKRIVLLISILSILVNSEAASSKYRVADIPKNLLENAKAVLRNSEVVFEISDIDEAVLKEVFAITILNKNGLDNSVFKQIYDKFSSVRKLKATLYDQNGNVIRTGQPNSVLDIALAAFSGSLFEDNRVKILDPKYSSTPFTVEFTYEISYNGLLSYPSWVLYDDYNVSIEKSSFTAIVPFGFKLRYLERGLENKCEIRQIDMKIHYDWKISLFPAQRQEPFSLSLYDFSPAVFLAPGNFEIAGVPGNCESWTNFGLWIKKLGEQRNYLGEEVKKKLLTLVAGETSDLEKVRLLYNYMQNKVRYISIQIGIGGWQPIDAETVENVSYGDCKALANYMKSLLDAIGIKSYYTLARAGEDAPSLIQDFPSNQFNHAILCVPMNPDTTWLECTDQLIPFGFLGTFTDNRKVLLISDTGGIVVRTKEYSLEENTQKRTVNMKIDKDGNATSSIITDYRGLKYNAIVRVLRMDNADKIKYLNSNINLPHFELVNFNYKEIKDRDPGAIEMLNINIPYYCSFKDNKIIIRPNLLSRIKDVPVRSLHRKSPVVIKRPYSESDTVLLSFQSMIKSDFKPVDYSLKTIFGEYRYKISYENRKIIYSRSFKLYKGTFPSSEYDSFVDFFNNILAADNIQIMVDKL
jgi:hypothetical protein